MIGIQAKDIRRNRVGGGHFKWMHRTLTREAWVSAEKRVDQLLKKKKK